MLTLNQSEKNNNACTSSTKQPKLKMINTKRLLQFNCYVKIEVNGIEIKNKLYSSTALSTIVLVERLTEYEGCPPALFYILEIRNKNKDVVHQSNTNDIYRIIDKLINEGKLTLLIASNKDKVNIFISKSTFELLNSLLTQIKQTKTQQQQQQPVAAVNEVNNNINNQQNIKQLPVIHSSINNKRKYHELINKTKTTSLQHIPSSSSHLIHKQLKPVPVTHFIKTKLQQQQQLQKLKQMNNNKQHINYMMSFPIDLIYTIFIYIDNKTIINKISILNKQFKTYSDDYIEQLIIRDDTPSIIFNKIITRFNKTKTLIFGKAKNFSNKIIKYLDIDLKHLINLDISNIDTLNEQMLKRLFSKTNVGKVKSLKMNYYLESLCAGLFYILEFFTGLNKLYICNNGFDTKNVKQITQIVKFPRFYHSQIFKAIKMILLSDKHSSLQHLNLFVFNASNNYFNTNINEECLFKNLTHLSIDILLIDKIKQLQIFYQAKRLVQFKLDCILIKDTCNNINSGNNNNSSMNYNYVHLNLNEVDLYSNSNNELQIEQIDFDNDYFEVFSKMLYYMRNTLTHVSFGNFVNDEICKLISIYLKHQITYIKLNSDFITDNGIQCILSECSLITEIDLVGCTRFLGSAFYDIKELPLSLKKASLSITTHNFYRVINYLRQNGINADNHIIPNKN